MAEQAQPMTQDQLTALVNDAVKASVGPAITAAIEPLTKSTTDSLTEFRKALKPSEEASENDAATIDKALGKYRFGMKARALALGTLEHNSQEPAAVELAVKRLWAASASDGILKWLGAAKNLSVNNPTQAGAMVFPTYDPEWIELLRNNTVVRANARTVPMPRGATSRRRQTGTTTASYGPETGPIALSDPSLALVNLSYKKLTGATVVSNDLLRFAGSEADRFVQDDLLRVNALREDRAFLVGNPPADSGSPQGIRYQTLAANVAASAGVTLANIQSDFTDMIADVEDQNLPVNPGTAGFILSPRLVWTMYALATTTGDMIFAASLGGPNPSIFGYPIYKTTQLSVGNSWIGANGGLAIFAYWPAMEIHDSMSRTVETFRGGAYRDNTGTIQSGISNDETVITCIAEHDFFQVYPQAAAIKTGYAV
jgi:HK97 family phage major capsid protein